MTHIKVTNNFDMSEPDWLDHKQQLKQQCWDHQAVHVSLAAWGPPVEYLAPGFDFYLLWDRVNQVLAEIPDSRLVFDVAIHNLSATTLENLYAGILGLRKVYSHSYQRVLINMSVLHDPAERSLQILPQSYVDHLEYVWAWMIRNAAQPECPFHGFTSEEIHQLDQVVEWMQLAQTQDHSQAQADFYWFITQHDQRSGTDFLTVFPDMHEWWHQCKQCAEPTTV